MQKTLDITVAGESAMVVAVDGGNKVRCRLESMGIIPGVLVDVVSNNEGPMIISLGEGRLMLGRGIAEKVLVA